MTESDEAGINRPHGLPVGDDEVLYLCLVAFTYRVATELGCDVRLELDPAQPGNQAHGARLHAGRKRKTIARKLVEACRVVHVPDFRDASSSR